MAVAGTETRPRVAEPPKSHAKDFFTHRPHGITKVHLDFDNLHWRHGCFR